jgi:hypothetical protein
MRRGLPTAGAAANRRRPVIAGTRFLLALAGAYVAAGIFSAAAVAQVQASAQRGIGVTSAVAVRDLDTTPQISATEIGRHPKPLAPLTGVSRAVYEARKARAAKLRFGPNSEAVPPATPAATDSGLLTPTAGRFPSTSEANCGDVTPADQALAVGDTPVGVLQAINVCLDVYQKNGALLAGYPKSLTAFVGLPANTPVTDPRALYDWVNHRYVVAFVQFDPNFASPSSYWIAVSTADSPSGTYCTYNMPVQSVSTSGGFFPIPDYPRLGQDRQALYLAANIFNPNYQWEEVLILPKAQMYACQGFRFNFFSGLSLSGAFTDSTQPANVSNPLDDPRSEYLVTSQNIEFGGGECQSGCNGLVVWAIANPLGGPKLTGTLVGTANNYSLPPRATQPGAANSVDSNDTRISGIAMYSAGSLYASLNTNGGQGQPAFILYQIRPFVDAGGDIAAAQILNEIPHGVGSAQSFFFATQQPDPEGNVTTVFNFSDAANFVGLAYASRRAAQPLGTLPDSGVFAMPGVAFYGQGRWGDYTAVAPSGLKSTAVQMWFAGMYARGDGTWGTEIGRNGYTSPTQP